VVLGQVSSEYFGSLCQFLFHQLLHNQHHLSSGAGTIGQTMAAAPNGQSHPTKNNNKKKLHTLEGAKQN
jgi:hypothetical protein